MIEMLTKKIYNTDMPRGVYQRNPEKKYGIWSLPKDQQAQIIKKRVKNRLDKGNYGQPKGADSPLWKGGRSVEATGYVAIYMPDYPGKKIRKMYVYEHRYVMERHLGRYLQNGEEIHHIDGNRQNNSLDNLMLFASKSEHLKYHWTLPNYKGRWT